MSKHSKKRAQKKEARKGNEPKSEPIPKTPNFRLLGAVALVAVVLVVVGFRVFGGSSRTGPVAFTILHTNDSRGFVDPCG